MGVGESGVNTSKITAYGVFGERVKKPVDVTDNGREGEGVFKNCTQIES